MTPEYAVQWPETSGILPMLPNFVCKWNHSVVQEGDFCSEWTALHRASELALQFGTSTCQDPCHAPCSSVRSNRRPVGGTSVSFCPDVEVYLGDMHTTHMYRTVVSAEVLSTGFKPWSSQWQPLDSHHTSGTYNYETDLGCPVEHLFAAFVNQPDGFVPSNDHVSRCGLSIQGCSSQTLMPKAFRDVPPLAVGFESSGNPLPSLAALIPSSQTTHDALSVHDPPTFAFPLHPGVCDSAIFQSFAQYWFESEVSTPNLIFSLESCCDPLSAVAVSIPGFKETAFRIRPQVRGHSQVPCDTSQGEGAQQTSAASSSAEGSSPSLPLGSNPSAHQQAPEVPAFALDVLTSLPQPFLVNPTRIVRGILVRSWLIHHVTLQRSLQPRQLSLRGPPHTWRAQLLAVWFGPHGPQEAVSIDLVKPTPPRNWHEASIVFDVVLAQGLEAGRISAVVTISPTFQHPVVQMYSLAVSFAPHISGQDLITNADVQDLCNLYSCLVFQDRVHLPINLDRWFQVQPGAGFVVYLSSDTEPNQHSEPVPVDDLDPMPEPVGDAVEPMEVEPSARSEILPDAETVQQHPLDPHPRQRVTLYRLGCQPVAIWVRAPTFDTLLYDVLAALGLEHDQFVALHRIRAKPVGEPFNEISFIVQRHGDVSLGSLDRLALLDVVFHQHGPAVTPSSIPAFDRRVVLLPSQVTRQGLLTVARVGHYCASRNDCLVSVDHVLWPQRHIALRSFPHGTYGRIHVPPPSSIGVETCRTVSCIENLCDPTHPTFEHVYPSLPSHRSTNQRNDYDRHSPVDALVDGISFVSGTIRECRAPEENDQPPSSFEVPIPPQGDPIFPNVPEWHTFELGLRVLFDDMSHTDIPEEGSVLHVVTWFVHHDRAPICIIGRLVRLSNRPWEWLQLLCTPWLPMIQPFENLAMHIVRPHPTPDLPGQQVIHVILEQGLQIGRHTALISALFHGIHGDVTHRRAQSIPPHLSREVIERLLGIDDVCRHRRCTAWSGRAQFHRQRLDQVYQGIGISFVVAPLHHRFARVDDDGYPITDAASSSQVPPRISFRADNATLFPHADGAALDEGTLTEHLPTRLIPVLRTIWEAYLMSTTTRPYRFYVETWFCDHDRFPRMHTSREVQLPPDQDNWRAALEAKWRDLIDPAAEVLIYVVDPQPIGGTSDVLARVILAQHQHRGFVSALITTLAPGDDTS